MKRAGVVFVDAVSSRAIRVSLAQPNDRERQDLMKKPMAALVALIVFTAFGAWAQTIVQDFDSIQAWAGLGSNRSALVLQWNDGNSPVSLAWGYRWDGAPTGYDLLTSVAGTTIIREPDGGAVIDTLTGADPSLEITIWRYGWGDSVYSMVYSPGATQRTQSDWSSGYWEYSLFGGNIDYYTWNGSGYDGPFNYNVTGSPLYSSVSNSWWSSQIGASDRLLVNGSWDAWSFAAGFSSVPVVQPVAAAVVPEPPISALLALSVFAAFVFFRRKHAS